MAKVALQIHNKLLHLRGIDEISVSVRGIEIFIQMKPYITNVVAEELIEDLQRLIDCVKTGVIDNRGYEYGNKL